MPTSIDNQEKHLTDLLAAREEEVRILHQERNQLQRRVDLLSREAAGRN